MGCYFETDVLVVGGGPSGASTALSLLSYSNLKVTIVEYSALDTVRVGEQVNPSLFELLSYLKINKDSFEKNSLIPGYSTLAAWGSSRLTTRDSIFSAQEESYQLDREQFDLLLLSEAAERGATIFPRTRCVNIKQAEDNYWQVELKHQTRGSFWVRAKFLVDATGRQSSICRQLGINVASDDQLAAIGAFLHFDNATIIKQDILLETVEEGWWYCAALPNQQKTTILFSDADIIKEKQLQKPENWNKLLLDTTHIKNKIKNASSYGKPWVRNAFSKITSSTWHHNFVAVGDAAASFDPVSGMGIGFAISSGCHAARALISFNEGDLSSIDTYRENVEAIYKNYVKIKSQFYGIERRWPNSLFWKRRLHTNQSGM